jgi:Tol biopolymer transport system component
LPPETRVTRLTDLPGLEEAPALSPDGKAPRVHRGGVSNQRHCVQLLAGGTPLRLTQDPVDHEPPRWTADSSTIVHFSLAAGQRARRCGRFSPRRSAAPRE